MVWFGKHDMPRSYFFCSAYFILNMILVSVYPVARALVIENNAQSIVGDSVSSLRRDFELAAVWTQQGAAHPVAHGRVFRHQVLYFLHPRTLFLLPISLRTHRLYSVVLFRRDQRGLLVHFCKLLRLGVRVATQVPGQVQGRQGHWG